MVQRTFERDVLDPNVDVMVLYEKSVNVRLEYQIALRRVHGARDRDERV